MPSVVLHPPRVSADYYPVRRIVFAAALCVTAFAVEIDEYQVKAAFLYNFAKFVHWPQRAFAGPTAPVTICVFGRNPFGFALEQTVAGKEFEGRKFLVRSISDTQSACQCHIVFVGGAEKKRFAALLAAVQDSSVLTVGESPGFAAQGGVVNFTLENGAIHFEVNLEAARHKDLEISAKLLSLATVTKP